MKKLLIGLILTLPITGYSINITINESCGSLLSDQCAELTQAIRDKANGETPDISLGTYATGIANSTAFSSKGQSSEYADNFDLLTIKGSVGAAVQGDLNDFQEAEGFGASAAVTVGLNLDLLPVDKIGDVELKNFDVFFSFMNYDVDTEKGDEEFKGDTSSFGMHIRWRFLEGQEYIAGHLVEWGGVQLHTGVQRTSMNLSLRRNLKDQSVTAGGLTGTFGDSLVKFDIESQITSIPFEISTSARLLYILTLYTGVGFDYNIGSTDISLNGAGNASGPSGYTAAISANEDQTGDADATNFRAFLGAQLNLPVVRLYVHANKGLGNDLLGVNGGIKFNW